MCICVDLFSSASLPPRTKKHPCRRRHHNHNETTMSASSLYIALILCCHTVFVPASVTAEAFNFQATFSLRSNKAHNTYLQNFIPSRRSKKSNTQIASVMTNSLEVLPNWREVDTQSDEEHGTICSPFCHAISSSVEASATAASWSDSALQAGLDLYERIKSCKDPFISSALTSAIHDLEMAYRLYGPFCMVGSYNGGKDAVVIFHLMRAVHAHYCHEMQQKEIIDSNNNGKGGKEESAVMIPRPRVIYFNNKDEFPEVLDLLQDTVGLYDLDMLAFKEGVSFGEGLKYLVERNYAPGMNGLSFYGNNNNNESTTHRHLPPPHPLAFILGTRSNDPNAGSQNIYAPSSHYMPPFLRVNPILNWNYGQVWHFLRTFELPYCKLYDDGYTSLGTVKDTLPCPALKKDNDEYWPAYMLSDWDQERAGRISKKKTKQPKEDSEPKNIEQTVTMSQTSSTVSLNNEQEATTTKEVSPAHSKTMSSVFNADEVSSDPVPEKLPSPRRLSVALIVIGDELLKGMTPDSNIIAAARALRASNVDLARVSIISDDSQEIVEEIQRVTKEVDVVITSGGVGPTHDDVTIKSVALALGLDMEIHFEMASLLLKKMSNSTEEGSVPPTSSSSDEDGLLRRMSVGQLKMATLPSKAELKYLTDNPDEWPVLKCDNIFILPGVPTFFEQKIQVLSKYLGESEEDKQAGLDIDISPSPSQVARSDTYRIVLSSEEDVIVGALNETVAAHPHVSFGSYPIVDNPEHKTIITLEGRFYNGGYTRSSSRLLDQARMNSGDDSDNSALFFTKQEMDEHLANALEGLKSRLPDESIISIDQGDDLK